MTTMLESLRDQLPDPRAHSLPGGAKLAARRQRALQDFLERGLPTTREEDWKYTSLTKLAQLELAIPASQIDPARIDQALARYALPDLDAHRLLFVNGHYHPHSGGYEFIAPSVKFQDGLTVLPLAAALAHGFDAERLGSVVDFQRYRFASLNQALFTDGLYVRVSAAAADKPLYLLFLSLGDERAALITPRVFIEAEDGGEIHVIEHYAGEGGRAVTNQVTEIVARSGGRVVHHRVQEQAATHLHIAGLNVRIDGDARVECHNVDLGGELVRNDVHVRLNAPDSEVVLNGLYYTTGTQHVDNHTRVDHDAPRTRSDEDYRGVLQDKSRAVFNGKVVVARDAQKIEAHQSNDNLMLGRGCEIDTKPELEIYADDVVCTHGATVGQIDETALFYLRSRGIDADAARGLLTYAFTNAILARIGVPALQQHLARRVLGRLPDHEHLEETLL